MKKRNITKDLIITIQVLEPYTIGKPMLLQFSIKNNTETTISFLKWNTPFEGLKSNILSIQDSKKNRVPYSGLLINRANPTKKDFITLESNDEAKTTIDISNAYLFKDLGHYLLKFEPAQLTCYINNTKRKKIYKVSQNIATFEINHKMSEFNSTIALQHRIQELELFKLNTSVDLFNFENPIIIMGGTDEQKELITQVHATAKEKITQTINSFNSEKVKNELIMNWFGFDSTQPEIANSIFPILAHIHYVFNNGKIYLDLTGGSASDSDYYAYTYPGSETIYLCAKFWEAPLEGFDSKFGTIIHELTHVHGGRGDYYCDSYDDRTECSRSLAAYNPDIAINNANNYEHFVEDLAIFLKNNPIV